nr:thioredoxin domain-containing protein [Candidatus Gracilibacteria bacterium]
MKKLIVLSFILINLFTLNVNAYSLNNVVKNTQKYENEFSKKLNLSKIDNKKLEKVKKQIEQLITKIENDATKDDTYKETMLGKLIALGNLIDKKINSMINITIIDDKRCTTCMTDQIIIQLNELPFLSNTNYIKKDFSDSGVSDYLKENNITKLPAIILSTNKLDDNGQMTSFLSELTDKQFLLNIGATFNPFIKRSDRGFLILEKDILDNIKSNSYLQGNKDAKITWIEFSDLECPYCAKLHNSDVASKITETYGDKVNKYFNHFPLEFHQNAFPAAMILECLGEQKGSDAFYSLIQISYSNQNSDKDYLIDEAVKLGADKTKLNTCINDGKYSEKISNEQSVGVSTFGIVGTPSNVIINNTTGEYEIISGAYPFDEFKKIIDMLLK